jgi:CrcB protein
VIGTLLRYALGRWFPTSGLPVTTIGLNVAGAFALGVLVALLDRRPSHLVRAVVGVGLLGSFTTFSTFVVDVDRLLDRGDTGLSVATVAVTLTAGIAAAFIGMRIAGSVAGRSAEGTR